MTGLSERVMDENELRDLFMESAKASIDELRATYRSLREQPEDPAARLKSMAETVHVLKGQGSSFGFPLITKIGKTFMSLLKGRESADEAALKLIEIHVDALALVIDQLIEGDGGELGATLVARLESKVEALA